MFTVSAKTALIELDSNLFLLALSRNVKANIVGYSIKISFDDDGL